MLSIRNLTRVVPRAFSRPSARLSSRAFPSLRQQPQGQQAWRIASISPRSHFSTALRALQAAKEGTTDDDLSAKFAEELQLEKEHSGTDEVPQHLQEYLDTSAFEVHDVVGDQEVTLTRSFGNEKITVSFSIADLNALDHDPDAYSQDRAMYDMDDALPDTQSGGAQSKGAINQGKTQDGNFNIAPEDRVAPADREELADEEAVPEPGFPVRLNITIEKDGLPNALNFEALAHDGAITIENVFHYAKKEFAEAKTAELDWARRNVYTGPPYGNLDENLQILLEKYLEERGVDTALAVWVPEYIDYKEQREYMTWLNDTKAFVDA